MLIPQKGSLFFYLCSFKYLFQHRKTGQRNEEVSPPHCVTVSVGSSVQRDGEGNLSVVSVGFSVQRRGGNPSPMCSVGFVFNTAEGRNPPCHICVVFDTTGTPTRRETSPLCLRGFSNTSGERDPPRRITATFPTSTLASPEMPNARAAEWLSKLIAWAAYSDYETLGFSDDLVTPRTYMFLLLIYLQPLGILMTCLGFCSLLILISLSRK